MIRFAWMQFRTNALVAGVGLIVLAIPVVITGAQLTHLYDTTVSNCATLHDCSAATSTFTDSNGFFGVVLPSFSSWPLPSSACSGEHHSLRANTRAARTGWPGLRV